MGKETQPAEKSFAKRKRQGSFIDKWLWVRDFLAKKMVRERILVFVSFLAIVGILQIDLVPRAIDVKLGEIYIGTEIRAPRTVINTEKTEELMDQAAARAVEENKDKLEYQTISIEAGVEANNRYNRIIGVFEEYRRLMQEQTPEGVSPDPARIRPEFRRALQREEGRFTEVPDETLDLVLTLPATDYERIVRSLRQVYVALETERKIGPQTMEEVRSELGAFVGNERFLVLPQDQPVIRELLTAMIFPNLTRDEAKIRQLQEEARRKVAPVKIEKGQLILSEGDIVTTEHIQILRELALIDNSGNRVLMFFSLGIFTLFLMAICLIYIYFFEKRILKEEQHLYLLALVSVVVLAVAKAFSLLNLDLMAYLVPLSFASIILVFLSEPKLAWVITALLSLMVGVIFDFHLALTVFYFINGTAALYLMLNLNQRKEMIRRGLYLAGINFFTVLTLSFLFGIKRFSSMFLFALVAGFNGILATALANGFLPFFEHLFGLTSPLSLLELANPNMPLLKRLLIEAPGTYHHSILVGNLAEAAADAIGADSLLVRVGAYYHDVGKLRRPYFFVENQITNDNPHENLAPSLSTLIITSHVRDGVELAKSYGVPRVVTDIIEQHHGTDLIRYFYQQASEKVQEEKESVEETDFSYSGPKPQTKEAALVMLADAVEAAARSMGQPSPARLEALVNQILKERLEAGQLDETNLTLRDLDKIKAAFLKVLGGIFHHRIKYPEIVATERKKSNGGNHQPRNNGTKAEQRDA
ncbi:HD family phosphohydrolase [Capillibacterium thermochitinicola]|uniref:HDIG domain-containing protein n=1 Tax=Capillibacterium thermochitinicola TaxID=2699427 RepID=A0A8J6I261_9FIRM|nr:HDIG domain-containing metalloprotein [Capillibacterium thermochitinicola]MBA2133049.1 HDIG domain-containing protein [Capillibacterium thermochitinicola]